MNTTPEVKRLIEEVFKGIIELSFLIIAAAYSVILAILASIPYTALYDLSEISRFTGVAFWQTSPYLIGASLIASVMLVLAFLAAPALRTHRNWVLFAASLVLGAVAVACYVMGRWMA